MSTLKMTMITTTYSLTKYTNVNALYFVCSVLKYVSLSPILIELKFPIGNYSFKAHGFKYNTIS